MDLCYSRTEIIQGSNSEYVSPIVLVKKKTEEMRLCIDYRALNKLTIKDRYPLPFIEDQLEQLKNKNYFTKLDLKSAFHQVKMSKESVKYTSFITPIGQFEYLKLPLAFVIHLRYL